MKKTEIHPDISLFPSVLQPYLQNVPIFDSSCSERAHTLYLKAEQPAFLKIDEEGRLYREQSMTRFMHLHELAPEVLLYHCEHGKDYLLTTALEGEDCISEKHLGAPERLAAALGEYLQVIHTLPLEGCPFPNRMAEMLVESEANLARGYADKEIIPEPIQHAADKLHALQSLAINDVVIHGDYCLPNIILKDFKLTGFVDLGAGGLGDRHYDLFWGIWSLKYNLHTDKYKDIFLDAYGRHKINPDRLELCRLLAGFTE